MNRPEKAAPTSTRGGEPSGRLLAGRRRRAGEPLQDSPRKQPG
jgi:hypothetical protein